MSKPLHPSAAHLSSRRACLGTLAALGLAGAAGPGWPQAQEPGLLDGLRLLQAGDGRPFDPARLRGRTVLLHMVFTQCATTCPVTLLQLRRLREQLDREPRQQITFVSVSADPLSDTPERLAQFADRHGMRSPRWWWLTGDPGQVQRLSERMAGRPASKPASRDDHPTALHLIDGLGRRLARFNGVEPDLPRLQTELLKFDRLYGRAPGG